MKVACLLIRLFHDNCINYELLFTPQASFHASFLLIGHYFCFHSVLIHFVCNTRRYNFVHSTQAGYWAVFSWVRQAHTFRYPISHSSCQECRHFFLFYYYFIDEVSHLFMRGEQLLILEILNFITSSCFPIRQC